MAPKHGIDSMQEDTETIDNKLDTKTVATNIITQNSNSCNDAPMDIERHNPTVDTSPDDWSPTSNTSSQSNLSPFIADSKNASSTLVDINPPCKGVSISTVPSIDMFADNDDHCSTLGTDIDGLECSVGVESGCGSLDKKGGRDSTAPDSLVNNATSEST